jgi:hypothetical protein
MLHDRHYVGYNLCAACPGILNHGHLDGGDYLARRSRTVLQVMITTPPFPVGIDHTCDITDKDDPRRRTGEGRDRVVTHVAGALRSIIDSHD